MTKSYLTSLYYLVWIHWKLADSLAFSHPIAFSIEAVLLRNEEGFQLDVSIQFKSFSFFFCPLALIGDLAHRLFLNKQTNEVYFDFEHYIRYLLIFISIDDSAKYCQLHSFKKKSCYVFKTDDEINVNKMEAKQVFCFMHDLKFLWKIWIM